MNIFLQVGTKVVVLALIAYSIAIVTEQRRHLVTNLVLWFITIGIALDVTATTFMILGSANSPFTPHGILGYSSLAAMFIDAILLWKFRIQNGVIATTAKGLHRYSKIAYIWWILAFITGGIIVMLK